MIRPLLQKQVPNQLLKNTDLSPEMNTATTSTRTTRAIGLASFVAPAVCRGGMRAIISSSPAVRSESSERPVVDQSYDASFIALGLHGKSQDLKNGLGNWQQADARDWIRDDGGVKLN